MTDNADRKRDALTQPATHRLGPDGEAPPEGSRARGAFDSRSLSGMTLAEGRFEVLRRLGEGGTGVVYEVHDRVRREQVALKTLARLEPTNIQRLKNEFRSLVEVVYPNLVGLHELFFEDDLWFFTMDLVRGVDFVSHVRGARDAPPRPGTQDNAALLVRLRDAMRQLTAGVAAIHRVGKLHCDLKPSNVLVTETGKVYILDFGLVTEARLRPDRAPLQTGLFGTPDYLAPERIEGSPASEASDWFAVGVVLFECLTGQLPYQDNRFLALRHRQTSPPPSPADVVPGLPDDLCALCEGLLESDPERRAGERELVAVLGQQPEAISGAHARVQEEMPELVGRARELQQLEDALRETERGSPTLATLPGLSGMGKTALMGAFLQPLSLARRAVVLSGRCHQWESVPYKTLDAVIDELAYFWRSLPPTEAAALLPRDVFSLVRVFPVLSQVEAIARSPQRELAVRDPQELRRRAFGALRELLGRIGDRYTLVLAIDDLQWGDRESARELVELLSRPDAPCMLVLCAYRADEVQPGGALSGLLSALEGAQVVHVEVPVGPLNDAAAAELAGRLAGAKGGEEPPFDDLVREAEGSPFFLGELIRSQGKVPVDQPLRLSTVVQWRLQELPATERELLDLVVVSPGPVEGDILRQVSGLAAAFDGALRSLLSAGLLRTRGGRVRDLVEPYHDRIREAVARGLARDAWRRHHEAFSDVLQLRADVDPETLAVHLEGAGRTEKAARHFERAARRSLDALAFDHAAMLFRRALELGQHGAATRSELETRLAEALAYAGRGPESAEAYLAAAEHGPPELRNYLQLHAAEQLLYAGHGKAALALLEGVLPTFGVSLPKSQVVLVAKLIFDSLRLARRAPARVRPPAEQDARAARRAHICATLGDAVLYFDFGLFAYFQQRHVLYGLASGEPGRVAEALTTRAMLTASPFPHKFDSVVGDLEQAEEIAKGVDDPEVRGRIAVSRAIVHSAVGHYVETERLAREAERIFRSECQGVKWGLQLAVLWQSVALFYLGRFESLDALCREHLPHAHRRADRTLTMLLSIWQAWAELAAGRPDRAEEVSPPPPLHRAFTVIDGGTVTQRGPMLLYMGRSQEAWELFEAAEPLLRQSGVMRARARAFEFHWTRGLAGAHLLAQGATSRVTKVLEADIRELTASRTVEGQAMAEHLRGARAGALGDQATAQRHYLAAAEGYGERSMAAFESTLRLAAAHMSEAGPERDVDKLAASLMRLGVHAHSEWLSLWCPGWKRA